MKELLIRFAVITIILETYRIYSKHLKKKGKGKKHNILDEISIQRAINNALVIVISAAICFFAKKFV